VRVPATSTIVAIAVLTFLLAIPPSGAVGARGAGPTIAAPLGTMQTVDRALAAPVASAPASEVPRVFSNMTIAPALLRERPSSAPPAISALQVTPAPTPPNTVPTVMTFLTNSTTCCVEQNFSAPAGGPWALVVLNYTGQAVGGVYDSSFRAYIDQVQVLFGTTPEYGIWFVSQDVTRYESLIAGVFNFTFLLSAATVGGHFVTSVSLSFYPPAAGSVAPTEPNLIIPLFHRVFVSTVTPSVYDDAVVPTDVVNATLEMWSYGFGPDEFWYATPQSYRNVYVAVDARPIVALLPFPYVNTGGEDLFTWRPITAVFTLSDRPYEYDVSGALGMIEGSHNFTANVSGVTASSNWLIGGALLLYTNASAGAATTLSYRFSAPTPHYGSGPSGDTSSAAPSYSYSAEIPLAAGPENVSMSTNESFSLSLLPSSSGEWNNITGLESLAAHETIEWGATNYSVQRSIVYPLTMDLGQTLVITSTTGGTYPEYGNFTTYFLNGGQEWVESAARSLEGASGPKLVGSTLVDDRFSGGDNIYAGTEELTGPNAALLTSISYIASSTTIDLQESDFGGVLTTTFSHQLAGASYQPPGPNNAETILVNSVSEPLVAVLAASTTVLDVGRSVEIEPVAGGGRGPYTFSYSGVPAGCTASAVAAWSCSPTAAGVYDLSATAVDTGGASVSAGSLTLVVNARPAVAPTSNTTRLDVGQNAYVVANAFGGTGSLACDWTLNGTAPQVLPCADDFVFAPATPGTYQVTVAANDSLGESGTAVTIPLIAAVAPTISVSPGLGGNDTVGGAVTFTATILGGSGNETFAWYVNETEIAGVPGPVFTFAPAGAGSYIISVQATDATGATAFAGPFTWVVRSPTTAPTPGSGSGPDLAGELLLVGLGGILGAAVSIVAIRISQTRRIRPRR